MNEWRLAHREAAMANLERKQLIVDLMVQFRETFTSSSNSHSRERCAAAAAGAASATALHAAAPAKATAASAAEPEPGQQQQHHQALPPAATMFLSNPPQRQQQQQQQQQRKATPLSQNTAAATTSPSSKTTTEQDSADNTDQQQVCVGVACEKMLRKVLQSEAETWACSKLQPVAGMLVAPWLAHVDCVVCDKDLPSSLAPTAALHTRTKTTAMHGAAAAAAAAAVTGRQTTPQQPPPSPQRQQLQLQQQQNGDFVERICVRSVEMWTLCASALIRECIVRQQQLQAQVQSKQQQLKQQKMTQSSSPLLRTVVAALTNTATRLAERATLAITDILHQAHQYQLRNGRNAFTVPASAGREVTMQATNRLRTLHRASGPLVALVKLVEQLVQCECQTVYQHGMRVWNVLCPFIYGKLRRLISAAGMQPDSAAADTASPVRPAAVSDAHGNRISAERLYASLTLLVNDANGILAKLFESVMRDGSSSSTEIPTDAGRRKASGTAHRGQQPWRTLMYLFLGVAEASVAALHLGAQNHSGITISKVGGSECSASRSDHMNTAVGEGMDFFNMNMSWKKITKLLAVRADAIATSTAPLRHAPNQGCDVYHEVLHHAFELALQQLSAVARKMLARMSRNCWKSNPSSSVENMVAITSEQQLLTEIGRSLKIARFYLIQIRNMPVKACNVKTFSERFICACVFVLSTPHHEVVFKIPECKRRALLSQVSTLCGKVMCDILEQWCSASLDVEGAHPALCLCLSLRGCVEGQGPEVFSLLTPNCWAAGCLQFLSMLVHKATPSFIKSNCDGGVCTSGSIGGDVHLAVVYFDLLVPLLARLGPFALHTGVAYGHSCNDGDTAWNIESSWVCTSFRYAVTSLLSIPCHKMVTQWQKFMLCAAAHGSPVCRMVALASSLLFCAQTCGNVTVSPVVDAFLDTLYASISRCTAQSPFSQNVGPRLMALLASFLPALPLAAQQHMLDFFCGRRLEGHAVKQAAANGSSYVVASGYACPLPLRSVGIMLLADGSMLKSGVSLECITSLAHACVRECRNRFGCAGDMPPASGTRQFGAVERALYSRGECLVAILSFLSGAAVGRKFTKQLQLHFNDEILHGMVACLLQALPSSTGGVGYLVPRHYMLMLCAMHLPIFRSYISVEGTVRALESCSCVIDAFCENASPEAHRPLNATSAHFEAASFLIGPVCVFLHRSCILLAPLIGDTQQNARLHHVFSVYRNVFRNLLRRTVPTAPTGEMTTDVAPANSDWLLSAHVLQSFYAFSTHNKIFPTRLPELVPGSPGEPRQPQQQQKRAGTCPYETVCAFLRDVGDGTLHARDLKGSIEMIVRDMSIVQNIQATCPHSPMMDVEEKSSSTLPRFVGEKRSRSAAAAASGTVVKGGADVVVPDDDVAMLKRLRVELGSLTALLRSRTGVDGPIGFSSLSERAKEESARLHSTLLQLPKEMRTWIHDAVSMQ